MANAPLKLTLALLAACAAHLAHAQESYVREHYTKREVLIPMRDGVTLFTSIYAPKNISKRAPILLMRTPYSCRPYGADAYRASLGPEESFVREGYIFVYQDVRGRYMSGGEFKWMTPYIPNKTVGQVDEATDSWDTIDWLVKNVPFNNGRVGIYGTSFPGHYAAQALIEPHPALAAASPQAPMADNWLGDDMHHNGAFFLPHAMNFIAGFGKKRNGPTQDYGPRVFQHGTPDGYRFFLDMGPIKNSLTRYNMDQIEVWKEWLAHPDYDAYWQAQNVPQHLKRVGRLPVLLVGGWWDAEDLYGPLAIYRAIEQFNPDNRTTLVMGPWYHGTWNRGPGDALHDIRWSTKTGEIFRDVIQKPFFREHLWGEGKAEIPEAFVFDVGADRFNSFSEWPPRGTTKEVATFGPGGELHVRTKTRETGRAQFHEYVSDPRRPVPASATISTGMPRSYLIEDQRFVWSRPDVLSYESHELTEDITLAGPVRAVLNVQTTGTDADFIVKLIDVLPNNAPNNSPRGEAVVLGGYQMLIRGEPMRAKYRNSWSKPSPLNPKRVEQVAFTMPDVMHTFKKGHRIMVQVQSSWFPVVDRNPHKFMNIMQADEKDFQKATHRLYVTGPNRSTIELTVIGSAGNSLAARGLR